MQSRRGVDGRANHEEAIGIVHGAPEIGVGVQGLRESASALDDVPSCTRADEGFARSGTDEFVRIRRDPATNYIRHQLLRSRGFIRKPRGKQGEAMRWRIRESNLFSLPLLL